MCVCVCVVKRAAHRTADLTGVLEAAFAEHFNPRRVKPGFPPGHAPTTMLIITYVSVTSRRASSVECVCCYTLCHAVVVVSLSLALMRL